MTRRRWQRCWSAALPGAAWGRTTTVTGGSGTSRTGSASSARPSRARRRPEANMPFLPGDRVWTDDRGRVEFQFESGAFLRLDNGTKLDYLDDAGERVVLRLWSGGALRPCRRRRHRLRDRDPGGVSPPAAAASIGSTRTRARRPPLGLRGRGDPRRRAAASASARASACTAAGRRGRPRADGVRPRRDADDFAMWADDRQEKVRYARERPADLPEHAAPYYDELYDHGSWGHEPSVGYVWHPRVAAGLAARTRSGAGCGRRTDGRGSPPSPGAGRRSTTAAGDSRRAAGTGSRGASGRRRGCSWAVGGRSVGWCPLGYDDRPIFDPYANVKTPLGRHASAARSARSSWRFARANELTKWNHTGNGLQHVHPRHADAGRRVAAGAAEQGPAGGRRPDPRGHAAHGRDAALGGDPCALPGGRARRRGGAGAPAERPRPRTAVREPSASRHPPARPLPRQPGRA